jgi:hypothetical protein
MIVVVKFDHMSVEGHEGVRDCHAAQVLSRPGAQKDDALEADVEPIQPEDIWRYLRKSAWPREKYLVPCPIAALQ